MINIRRNHNRENTKNGSGCIFLKEYNTADVMAKIFVKIKIALISGLFRKWYLSAWITCFLS
jgi:hypothetical protein